MHIEILVEDSSGKKLLEYLMPKLLGPQGAQNTWRLHPYKGIGRIPRGLLPSADPAKRILLDQLPKLLRGYGRTPGVDAVVVVVDADRRNCAEFLSELKGVTAACNPRPKITLFRLAIEEMEAWYFGDRQALQRAYPRAKKKFLDIYVQDGAVGTWELLANAIHPGGSTVLKNAGWPAPGDVKHEWAEKIGPLMNIDGNASPSFEKFRDGIRRLVGKP